MDLAHELKKKHAFPSLEEEAYLSLLRTHAVLAHRVNHLFKQHGLSEATYNILRILRGVHDYPEHDPCDLPCHEIVTRLVAPVPDLTRLVDRLETAGLVTRQREAEDRRVVRVAITERGLQRLAELDEPIAAVHRENLGHMDPEALRELIRLLGEARSAPTAAK